MGHREADLSTRLLTNLPLAASWLAGYLTLPVVALVVLGVALGLRTRPRATLFLAALVVLPVLAFAAVSTLWFPRYLVPVTVPALLLAAQGFVSSTARLPRAARGLLLALLLVPALRLDADLVRAPERAALPPVEREQFVLGWPSGYGTRGTLALVREELLREPQGLIVVAHVHARRTTWLALGLEFAREPRVELRDLDLTRPENLDVLAAWAQAKPTLVVLSPVGPAQPRARPWGLRSPGAARPALVQARRRSLRRRLSPLAVGGRTAPVTEARREARPVVLLAPSAAAARELLRRLASTGQALAGIYPFKLQDLARSLAEPVLLGQGLRAWDSGHAALLAARFLDGPHGLRLPEHLPRAPVARALAQTLVALRRAGTAPERLEALAREDRRAAEDRERLRALASLSRRFHEAVEGRFADPVTVLRAAAGHAGQAQWLRDATILVVDELDLGPAEREFLVALSRSHPVERLERALPPGLRASSFAAWAEGASLRSRPPQETPLAPLAPPPPPAGLARLREELFEPAKGAPAEDGSVEIVTAPGEAAEAAAIVRRLLREAGRGVPFEEMGVLLPRPDVYAPVFADLCRRLQIPLRLHPSLPLSTGRSARSLLLLFRCRGLTRPAVMEFLTFAPVPWKELLGDESLARPEQWDQLSRDAQIVSELPRWIVGLRAHAEAEREAEKEEASEARRAKRRERAEDAERLVDRGGVVGRHPRRAGGQGDLGRVVRLVSPTSSTSGWGPAPTEKR